MKRLACIILFFGCLSFSHSVSGQRIEKTTFKVSGPCMACGFARLDSVLQTLPGYHSAIYNDQTQMLSMEIDRDKGSAIDIQLELSFKGYNAGDFDYTPLPGMPGCCRQKKKNNPSQTLTVTQSSQKTTSKTAISSPKTTVVTPKTTPASPTTTVSSVKTTLSSPKVNPPKSNPTPSATGKIAPKTTKDVVTPAAKPTPQPVREIAEPDNSEETGTVVEPVMVKQTVKTVVSPTSSREDPFKLDNDIEEEIDDEFIWGDDSGDEWGGWYDTDDNGNLIKVDPDESSEHSTESKVIPEPKK